MLNGLGAGTGITNITSFYPSPVQGQITDLASFYPTAPYVPTSPAPGGGSGGSVSTQLIQAATAAGLTPTAFTQQAVNAGYAPTQWATMTAAQRTAALTSGRLASGAPAGTTSLTPIFLIGGALLLFLAIKK